MQNLLRTLCAMPCVSGDEAYTADALMPLLEPFGGDIESLSNGTVICRLPKAKDGLPKVMLTAHLDRIGLMAMRVSDKGFVHMAAVGGVDRRTLAGARVTIYTKTGPVCGVICSTPPHLSNGDGKLIKSDDVAVDIGMTAERAREIVGYGDRAVFDSPFTEFMGDRVCSPALDDRAGCAVILQAANLLKNAENAEMILAFASQEEVGCLGSGTAANAVQPDYCFAVDVTFADAPDEREGDTVKLGGGPAVGYAPILDRRLSALLSETAERKNIPWQPEVMAGRTGTDADSVAISGRGVRTALVSIPQRYMHTAGEIVSVSDCDHCARLLAAVIGGIR